jgi:hypothetical protein
MVAMGDAADESHRLYMSTVKLISPLKAKKRSPDLKPRKSRIKESDLPTSAAYNRASVTFQLPVINGLQYFFISTAH